MPCTYLSRFVAGDISFRGHFIDNMKDRVTIILSSIYFGDAIYLVKAYCFMFWVLGFGFWIIFVAVLIPT